MEEEALCVERDISSLFDLVLIRKTLPTNGNFLRHLSFRFFLRVVRVILSL